MAKVINEHQTRYERDILGDDRRNGEIVPAVRPADRLSELSHPRPRITP